MSTTVEGATGAPSVEDAAEDARFRGLVGALRRTVTDPDAETALRADARGWLAAQGLDGEDVEALARYAPSRLVVYRKLVHRGLAAAARIQMPRTVRRLGARLEGEIARMCGDALPRSHYLRDAPREMIERLAPRWAADPTLPAFLAELARHELSLYEIGAAPPQPARVDAAALDLARPVVFDAAARLLRYRYPVHRLRDDDVALAPEPAVLLGYRDAEHDVRYLELTPFGAELVERLLGGATLADAVRSACERAGLAVDATAIGRASTLLADLAGRGTLLGAAR